MLGGDHGQGVFKLVIKGIIRDGNNEIIDSFLIKVAHVDCKHDTYYI